VKHAEEIMRILEAFDLTRSYRAAGELAGCDHHTVAHWVCVAADFARPTGREAALQQPSSVARYGTVRRFRTCRYRAAGARRRTRRSERSPDGVSSGGRQLGRWSGKVQVPLRISGRGRWSRIR